MTDAVLLEIKGAVATVTLNRPDQRNAINEDVCAGLRAAFDRIEQDNDIRASVLTGAGQTFCAGMDLKAFANGDADAILFGEHGFGGFVRRVRSKPVIAAVEGAALAGGFEIMLACDLVIAAESAQFGLPEAKLGLFAGAGGALRLAKRIPRVRANEIMLTGELFDAATAMDLGLLNKIVPKAASLETAFVLAKGIAECAPLSIRASLDVSNATLPSQEDWALNNQMLRDIGQSSDAAEGTRAFLEKRQPKWTGH